MASSTSTAPIRSRTRHHYQPIEMLAIVLLPAALTHTFGRMIGRPRHGWILFWVMTVLFASGLLMHEWAERKGNPLLAQAINANAAANQTRANMEGTVRFESPLDPCCHCPRTARPVYNSMHDSYTPLGV